MRLALKITINEKEFKTTTPTSWHDVTMKELLELTTCDVNDTLAVMSILTDIPRNILQKANIDDIEKSLIPYLGWTQEEFDFSKLSAPKYVTIGGALWAVPNDLGLKTYGQKIAVEQFVNEEKNAVKLLAEVMAIYFQPIVSKMPYDDDQVELFREHVYGMKAVDAYPTATFFLMNFLALQNTKLNSSQKGLTRLKKWLASKGWFRLGISQRLIRLRVEMPQSMNKS